MNDKIWKACSLASALFAAAAAVVSAALGGCDVMLECANGLVPMKCHWCFSAVLAESVAACVLALFGLAQKTLEGRRAIACAVAVFALVVLAECYVVIGVCAMAGMECHTTRMIVTVLSVLMLAACAVGAVCAARAAHADAGAAEKPKMKL